MYGRGFGFCRDISLYQYFAVGKYSGKNNGKSENGYSAEDLTAALNRLGQFEDLYENLCRERGETAEKMKALAAQGKTKTVSYKQLFAGKLTLMNMISKIEIYVK